MTRRDFLKGAAATAAAGLGPAAFAAKPDQIRAVLLHLGMNMWGDWRAPGEEVCEGVRYARDHVFFDETVWRKTVDHARARGLNMVLMDIGEFVRYPSHPELAVKGSWEPARLNAEVRRLRSLGLEPIPKLNFASPHDSWLKEYHRMLGTSAYYRVVSDVIRDVCEIFERPRFLHIGWDEESWEYQRQFPFAVVRQRAVWWHDFLWLGETVRKLGMRPWTWVGEWIGDSYLKKCPKDVLQSNYCYDSRGLGFDIEKARKIIAGIKEAEAKGSGVISVNGKMVDRPVVLRAQRTMELAIASGILTREEAYE